MKRRITGIIDNITGSFDELYTRYSKLTGRDEEKRVTDQKNALLKIYAIIVIATLFLLLMNGIENSLQNSEFSIKDGNIVSLKRDDKTEKSVSMIADIEGEERKITVYIEPVGEDIEFVDEEEAKQKEKIEENEEEEDKEEEYLNEIIEQIENDPAKHEIVLPKTLNDGRRISFHLEREYTWVFIVIVSIFLIFIVYGSRFNKIKKTETESRDSVIRELPQFLNKITLMMEGGIVLTDAIDRIIEEREVNSGADNYFYGRLSDIRMLVIETNGNYGKEILNFARNTGVHEFIRIANIIMDNVEKGADLAEKLEAESRYLWFERKKKAEEAGKMAETKLTFPLVILLMSLIIMTIAPAMLEM